MTGRYRVAELVDHGVTVLVDLVDENNRLHYEITARGYVARLSRCGCDLLGCAGKGGWGRRCTLYSDSTGAAQAHGRQACHGSRHGGWHGEHAVALARIVLASFRAKKSTPKALNGGARIDPNRPNSYHQFSQLDGEETVDLYSLKTRSTGPGESETVAARLVCNSRRCVVEGRSWRRLVVELPGTAYDHHDDSRDERVEGRNPFEVRNEHIRWHRENFPPHPRVALDRWIRDNAMVTAPEPGRAELDRQRLATAGGGRAA